MEKVGEADHAVSLPFMRLELPKFLEFALTIPSCWFAIPCTNQSILPLLCAALAEGGDSTLLIACGVVVAGWFMLWSHLLENKGVRNGTDQIIGSATAFLFAPYIGLGIVKLLSPTNLGTAAASLCITLYHVTQSVTSLPKWTALRQRPIKVLQAELATVKRFYPIASDSKYIADKLAPYESFWSGDSAVAGGAATMVCLMAQVGGVISPELVLAAAVVAQLTAFGRMYFHCHFFGDVLCGCACGMLVAFALFSACDWRQFGVLQPCVAHLTFVVLYTVVRKALVKSHLKEIEKLEGQQQQQHSVSAANRSGSGSSGSGSGSVSGGGGALPKGKRWFHPTSEWQAVEEDHVCPRGLQFKMDVHAGVSMARLMQPKSTSAGGGGWWSGGGWMDSIAKMFKTETAADRIAAKRARIRAEKATAKAK